MTCVAKTFIFCVLGLPLAGADTQTLSPVTRVVELLQGLSKQIEKEGKSEESLYDDFVCWGKSLISEKKAAIAAALSRDDELKTYLADLSAGRIELTSERTDLEKDVSELMEDMETATAMRNKEHDDFEEAKDEMNQAIDALEAALKVLHDATSKHNTTDGVLLAVRTRLKGAAENGGMAALAQHQASLRKAAVMGERFLNKADATFLKRVLLGEVPEVDWNKLNRKSTFKMRYKARSFKIQEVLENMHNSFVANREDAKKKEATALKDHTDLLSKKQEQLDAARGNLRNMDSEKSAKGMSKQESNAERKALNDQIDIDKSIIAETQQALDEKAKSWKVRSDLRTQELAAISKATYILHNDDARDLFKRSFSSQGFLQVHRTAHKATMHREQSAAVALRDAAIRSGDKRLLALASDLEKPKVEIGDFGEVIKEIDVMLSDLRQEEQVDLDTKQTCESDRMDNTREAAKLSRSIDEQSDVVTAQETVIEDCRQKIQGLNAEVDKTKVTLEKARSIRESEEKAWEATNKDDTAAASIVKKARDVLSTFYQNTFLKDNAFLQRGKGKDAPPPPPTWEGGYGGKTGEQSGIVAIMDMVHEDIMKDLKDSKADEDASAKEFADFETNCKSRITVLTDENSTTFADLGRAMKANETAAEGRADDKKILDETLATIKTINPNCEYYEVNYPMRKRNRQIEMDGLRKAKAILRGGKFDAPDPNREIKPGDAASAVLLQSRTRS